MTKWEDEDKATNDVAELRAEFRSRLYGEQPAPTPTDGPSVWDMVIADMHARDALGRGRYGTPVQPFNGRDALRDAYEEALDLCVYLRQVIAERDVPR